MSPVQHKNTMQKPEKAVILAAGLGTRMQLLSSAVPKPLLPVWGRPVLEHTLQKLSTWGVKDVLINIHHKPDAVFDFVRKIKNLKMKINFSFESQILGTGGALKKAEWFLHTPCFWVVNSDIIFDVSPDPFIRTMSLGKYAAALWLTAKSGPRTVEMKRQMITSFASKKPGSADTFTFTGLQLASSRILEYIPEARFSTIVSAYEKLMHDNSKIAGICIEKSYWSDIGTVAAYLDAHKSIKQRFHKKEPGWKMYNTKRTIPEISRPGTSTQINGFISTGNNVIIRHHSRISNSILMDNCHIGPYAIIKNAVLAPYTKVQNREIQGLAVPALSQNNNDILSTISKLGWHPEDTSLDPLSPRGSARTYTRIICGRKSAIFVKYDPTRTENAFYTAHTRFLKKTGLRVPRLYLDMPDRNTYVIEDAGNHSLTEFVKNAGQKNIISGYKRIIEMIARLHQHIPGKSATKHLPLNPPFSKDLYAWERQLFKDHLLSKQTWLTPRQQNAIMQDIRQTASVLLTVPHCLLHRDLQSSNIILLRSEYVFIDFQGMRFGPAVYDLASLLCDPYVSLDPPIQDTLIRYCSEIYAMPHKKFHYLFWNAAVERLVQAIGAFGRLSSNRDTASFKSYIKPAIAMLARATSTLRNHSHLRDFCATFQSRKDII